MSNTPSRESSSLSPALWIAAGAAAGVIVGVVLADRVGGGRKLRRRLGGLLDAAKQWASTLDTATDDEPEYDEYGAEVEDEVDAEDDGAPDIDERVLAAFEQDPILSQLAIEIDADKPDHIVLTGRVASAEDAAHAATIARGTPGVAQVENLIRVRPTRAH